MNVEPKFDGDTTANQQNKVDKVTARIEKQQQQQWRRLELYRRGTAGVNADIYCFNAIERVCLRTRKCVR